MSDTKTIIFASKNPPYMAGDKATFSTAKADKFIEAGRAHEAPAEKPATKRKTSGGGGSKKSTTRQSTSGKNRQQRSARNRQQLTEKKQQASSDGGSE